MKKIKHFESTLFNYGMYQKCIKALYPGEHLSIQENDYKGLVVFSIRGRVGTFFKDDCDEIYPFFKEPDKYYIDCYLKHFRSKNKIKVEIDVVVEIFEKDADFVEPQYEYLGDYATELKQWEWYEIDNGLSPKTLTVNTLDFESDLTDLEGYNNLKLVINDNVADVYSVLGEKIGSLSKEMSETYIPYMKDAKYFFIIDTVKNNEINNAICIHVYEKKTRIVKNKS